MLWARAPKYILRPKPRKRRVVYFSFVSPIVFVVSRDHILDAAYFLAG